LARGFETTSQLEEFTMDISFKQFVRLTVLLAAGSVALPGCKATEDDAKTNGGAGTTNSAGQGGEEAGASGSAGKATAGSSGQEAGGSAGTPTDEGLGGSAGTPTDEGFGGSAGEGAAGASGAAACVAGDPAEEGGGLDCSTLSYADVTCPDPTGEGTTITHGLRVCQRYAAERAESAAVLLECLSGLTQPTEGWCGAEHRTDVEGCVTAMEGQTCTASNAQTICEATHAGCAAVSVDECVLDVGPLAETEYAELATCVTTDTSAVACRGDYVSTCLQMPDRLLTTEEGCASVIANCSELTEAECMLGMATHTGTEQIWESTLRMIVNFCVTDYQTNEGMSCAEAWTACNE
jgi:hypothetical protein